ncbi:small ribosomal subunit protein mS40 [Salarias fasciatus]|uniref:Small ribosomal subunit protein mS40 n=1 Tax=Salarias fasciatus TaxID=181472 RepID=A0A672FK19_SALFA|nr:28S ribosomal protein S18b, mitochondrial [Salarias fasciatus]
MAASMQLICRALSRLSPSVSRSSRQCTSVFQTLDLRTRPGLCAAPHPAPHPAQAYCTAAAPGPDAPGPDLDSRSRYAEKPWEYLDSEEYEEKYGSDPVWTGYRRNHKGGIPPQKTRKTCIRGDKICGNPCPICRDPHIRVHPQNVKLLQQFISPHSGVLYDPTRTGVCMKQQKKLNEAISTARDHGLLPFQIPYVDFTAEDYSNSHQAVGCTPPPPSPGDSWYHWYQEMTPDAGAVAKVKKIYRDYLK